MAEKCLATASLDDCGMITGLEMSVHGSRSYEFF